MIRILHTADWHIGQTLRGFAREHEHACVFDALVAIVAEREVDALVVAGDIFDSQNPSGEAQRLFYDLLVRLNRARPQMTTVITAGNHDAAGRLEAPRPLLDAIGVHIVGNVRRRDGAPDLTRHLVPLRRKGQVAAHVLAVSYPTASCLPGLAAGRSREDGGSPIVHAVRNLYAGCGRRTGSGRVGLDSPAGTRFGPATSGCGISRIPPPRASKGVKGGPISGRRGGVKPGHGLRTA